MFPLIFNKINLQGGTLLVNNPVYTNTSFSLGTYQDLNGSDKFDYQYAISFWFFLDANTQSSQKYSSILNFGEKPNVLYNNEKNTLIVTMPNDVQIKNNKTNKNNKNNKTKDSNDNVNSPRNDNNDVVDDDDNTDDDVDN